MSKEKKCEQCENCICKSCVQVAWLQEMLKEIKEIALRSNMPPCLDIDCKCENCKDIVTNKDFNCMQYGLKKILQKISEVV